MHWRDDGFLVDERGIMIGFEGPSLFYGRNYRVLGDFPYMTMIERKYRNALDGRAWVEAEVKLRAVAELA